MAPTAIKQCNEIAFRCLHNNPDRNTIAALARELRHEAADRGLTRCPENAAPHLRTTLRVRTQPMGAQASRAGAIRVGWPTDRRG